MEKTIVSTGKTIDLAVEAALNQLGLDRDSVSVMVLQQAKSGFLGFGAGGRCVGRFFCGLPGFSLFRLGGQVNAALLADNLIMPVNIGNQFPGRLVDGL